MSERPSTSGGPSSKRLAKNAPDFDKRVSRDDSFLDLRVGRGAGFRPYTPGRGQTSTPEASSRSSPSSRVAFFPTATIPTPESFNEEKFGQIGMAIGSPTRRPQKGGTSTSQSSLRPRQTSAPGLSPASGNSSADSFDMPAPKKQPGKWKLLGLFGRKHSDHSDSAASTSEPTGSKRSYRPTHAEPSVTSFQSYPEAKGVGRSETMKERKASSRQKPVVHRSQTMPQIESPQREQRPRPRDLKVTDDFGRTPTTLDAGPRLRGPMLDVEIPDVTMERYSVMFGSVLQPQPSSLLARRQATLQKLKSIDDAVEQEEEEKHHIKSRHRESQPATKSPGFALFPSTPSSKPRNLQAPRSSPHLRSNTSPAMLPSPSRGTFDHQPSSDDVPVFNHLKHPPTHHTKSKLTIATLSRAREQQEAVKEHQFGNDQSTLVDSPSSIGSPVIEVAKMEALRPSAHHLPPEPKWQMMNSSQVTVSTAISVSSERKRSPSSAASSAPTHVTQISQDIEEARLAENSGNAKMNPVEISIARQISISRQQQKMLQPLRARAAAASPSAASYSSGSRGAVSPANMSPMVMTNPRMPIASTERIAETKTLTPTVVHPADPWDLQLAQNRKSERVILEGSS
ncbi:hypothetical protein F5X99DRAFT_115106 [Biscogniauxia marginata]|nr:hypothetical protein F5X99DRAFT_115106 [Biscogniauxia marginata]